MKIINFSHNLTRLVALILTISLFVFNVVTFNLTHLVLAGACLGIIEVLFQSYTHKTSLPSQIAGQINISPRTTPKAIMQRAA